jgi:ribosomal protein L40E
VLSSNTVITPLFEKMLSASDAGRIGRLVLPKACAEAYFPPIHQPEGLPLKIQDVTGKEWVFQFRFWPNNNSRMYVLEGVTPCIQSMRLQAGDTVTFSRLEADGKLVMGYRRAPSSLSSQDATGIATTPPSNNGLPCASYAAPQSLDGWASSKGGASAKLKDSSALTLAAAAAATQQMDRKRGRPLGSKSKRLRLDTDDALLLKSSWEEAQELLRPPPSAVPTTITIDGHEFEEYSEPPVFAKKTYPNITPSGEHEQWAQCDDCSNWRRLPATAFVPLRWSCSQNTWDLTRAQCNAPQEVSNEKLEMILRQVSGQEDGKQGGGSGSGSGSMRMMLVPTVAGDIITTTAAAAAAAAAGLDTLAQAAAATTGPVSPMRTTKHPRHRPGCSCIVCIQPPSGKGPKHKATCTCNVCVTVKRRFKTMMQRRKKRQFERESELARKKRGWARDDISDSASLLDAASRPETSAGGGGGGAVAEENPTTPLVYQSDDVGGGADEGGPSKAAATAAAIDLNSQPDRDERVSMVRLVQDAGKPLSTYLHQQHLMTLCAPDHPLSDKVSEEEDPNSSSSREEVASQTSSKAHADSGMQLVAAAAVTPMQQGQQQQPQSPFMVDIAELSSHMESWDPRAVKPVAEPSGDSVHSSSSKQEYNMLNQLVVSNAPASSKKYATGAGRGRQICSGCGEPIGSAAKVCRRCGTSTAFGKKKRSVPP